MKSQLTVAATIVLIVALAGMRFIFSDVDVHHEPQVAREHLKASQRMLLGETIDINTADSKTLEALPLIGQVLARRIVVDRQHNGPFKSLHDLMRVYGIGPRILARIEPYLAVKGMTGEKSSLH